MRIAWGPVIERAADIVASYGTSVTLRQVFYRLVAAGLIPNEDTSYKRLSALTAKGRRRRSFPDLADGTRWIRAAESWESIEDAKRWLADKYRRDRTEGQEHHVLLAVEKATLEAQMWDWFEDRGLHMTALRGYPSQTLVDQIRRHRYSVILYAGDFDPTGEDIVRDLDRRLYRSVPVVRVALTAEQVDSYGLPPAPGKATDSRAGRFMATHGDLVQVELEALDPNDLRQLFEDALAPYWDTSTYEEIVAEEEREREELTA